MNENLNLVEILKDYPKGAKLYSAIHGDVKFEGFSDHDEIYQVLVGDFNGVVTGYTSKGFYVDLPRGECVLFPSKGQRDWSKFEVTKKDYGFKPFDRVLVKHRTDESSLWTCDIYSHRSKFADDVYNECIGDSYNLKDYYFIPYEGNDDLVGTNKEPRI